MNMIEKVAIALAMSQNPGNWEVDFSEDHKKLWRIRAKVAIEAMHEPTEEMLEFETNDGNLFSWNCNCGYCGGHKFAVESYIDAALKEE